VTRDRARKKAIRARMAAGGEPYSVAARRVGATDPARQPAAAGPAVAADEIIARANRTLAAPGARIEFRIDTGWPERPARPRPRPGPFGRLVRRAGRAAWERIAPGVDAASLREAFTHQVGAGFLQAAAGRYQIDFGAYAQLYADGQLFGGQPGVTLQGRHHDRRGSRDAHDPLGLLMLLRDTSEARLAGDETVRGTSCRVAEVRTGATGLTVWIDDEHVRRVRFEEHASGEPPTVSRTVTLELWDFGPPAEPLDWSRLPSFPRPD
jgi:hypothetical protein